MSNLTFLKGPGGVATGLVGVLGAVALGLYLSGRLDPFVQEAATGQTAPPDAVPLADGPVAAMQPEMRNPEARIGESAPDAAEDAATRMDGAEALSDARTQTQSPAPTPSVTSAEPPAQTVAASAGATAGVDPDSAREAVEPSSSQRRPLDPSRTTEAATDPAPMPEASTAVDAPETPPTPQQAPDTDTEADTVSASPVAPTVDIVRVDASGGTVVAGRVASNTPLRLQVDGQEAARTDSDDAGNFVFLLDLGTSDRARILTLGIDGPDGTSSLTAPDIILAPRPPVTTATGPDVETPGVRADETASPGTRRAEAPTDAAEDLATPEGAGTPDPAVAERAQPGADVATAAPVMPMAQSGRPDTDDPALSAGRPSIVLPPAPQDLAPAVVLTSGPAGLEVIQPATEVATLPDGEFVALDAISYDDSGDVSLTGRASPNGTLRVYLDNDEVVLTDVGDSGRWQTGLPGVAAGTYTLRLDRIDAGGRVIARIESPFRRESRETLDAANTGNAAPVFAVTVQPGNTLWGISRDRYGEGPLYVKVFEANKGQIRNPDLIYPGQVFTLPH
ncbi:LysM peptidoglycan-binding domain-containing protein [Roseivivax sp. CAU 1753]